MEMLVINLIQNIYKRFAKRCVFGFVSLKAVSTPIRERKGVKICMYVLEKWRLEYLIMLL